MKRVKLTLADVFDRYTWRRSRSKVKASILQRSRELLNLLIATHTGLGCAGPAEFSAAYSLTLRRLSKHSASYH